MNSKIADQSQERASEAYNAVSEAIKELNNLDAKKKYKSYVKKFPAIVKTNGLSAAVAFEFSKKASNSTESDIHKKIYKQISKRLFKCGMCGDTQDDLMKILLEMESDIHRSATIEIIAYFEWMRRFAEGLVEG